MSDLRFLGVAINSSTSKGSNAGEDHHEGFLQYSDRFGTIYSFGLDTSWVSAGPLVMAGPLALVQNPLGSGPYGDGVTKRQIFELNTAMEEGTLRGIAMHPFDGLVQVHYIKKSDKLQYGGALSTANWFDTMYCLFGVQVAQLPLREDEQWYPEQFQRPVEMRIYPYGTTRFEWGIWQFQLDSGASLSELAPGGLYWLATGKLSLPDGEGALQYGQCDRTYIEPTGRSHNKSEKLLFSTLWALLDDEIQEAEVKTTAVYLAGPVPRYSGEDFNYSFDHSYSGEWMSGAVTIDGSLTFQDDYENLLLKESILSIESGIRIQISPLKFALNWEGSSSTIDQKGWNHKVGESIELESDVCSIIFDLSEYFFYPEPDVHFKAKVAAEFPIDGGYFSLYVKTIEPLVFDNRTLVSISHYPFEYIEVGIGFDAKEEL